MISKIGRFYNSLSDDTQGMVLMTIACFWFSVMASLIRHTTSTLDPFVVVFFRNIFSLLCILPWVYKLGFKNIRTTKLNLYFIRVLTGIIGMSIIFYSISVLPLTEVTALTFTIPIITTFFAMLYLGEKVKYYHFISLSVGFMGVMIILRPGTDAFQWVSLLLILATCFWSISNIVVKKLTKTDSPKAIVFIMISLMTPFSLPMAAIRWQTPDLIELFWLFMLGWVSNQAQFYMTRAYSKADITKVLPFDFSRLIFISVIALIFFNESIDLWTIIGGIVIFASSVYLVKKQSKKIEVPVTRRSV